MEGDKTLCGGDYSHSMSRSNNGAQVTMPMQMSSRGPIASRAPLLSVDGSKEGRTGDGSIDALSYECVSIHMVMWSTL